MKFKVLLLVIFSTLSSCTNLGKEAKVEEIALKFFDVYSERKDYNQLKSFYNDSVQYENVIQNTNLNTFATDYLLNQIFAFNDKDLVYDEGEMFNIINVVANDSVAVVNGEFKSYTYNGFTFTPMKFTTYLYFDKDLKIKKQVDWFNYPIGDLIELYQMDQSKSFDVKK